MDFTKMTKLDLKKAPEILEECDTFDHNIHEWVFNKLPLNNKNKEILIAKYEEKVDEKETDKKKQEKKKDLTTIKNE